MSQSRKLSLIESLTNVAIGFGVSLASQIVIFSGYGVKLPLIDNAAITVWFTLISIARSYLLRRAFNQVREPATMVGGRGLEAELAGVRYCTEAATWRPPVITAEQQAVAATWFRKSALSPQPPGGPQTAAESEAWLRERFDRESV